jgi:hypothetical protein
MVTVAVWHTKSMIYTHDSKDFNKAVALFKDDQYASAQIIFNKVKETATTEELKSDCAYYAANCAIRTNQSNADELMEQFVSEYPKCQTKSGILSGAFSF